MPSSSKQDLVMLAKGPTLRHDIMCTHNMNKSRNSDYYRSLHAERASDKDRQLNRRNSYD